MGKWNRSISIKQKVTSNYFSKRGSNSRPRHFFSVQLADIFNLLSYKYHALTNCAIGDDTITPENSSCEIESEQGFVKSSLNYAT